MHHVGYRVPDLEAAAERAARALGAGRSSVHPGGRLFPHPIELHRAGSQILGMHARLAALARDRDGSVLLRPM